MAAVITFLFICFGLAAADVAHLARSYLPPSRLVASPLTQAGFSGSRTSSFTAGRGYSDRLIQVVPSTSYIAPGSASFTSTNFVSDISAPAKLTAPATQTFIAPATQTFIAPATKSFTTSASQNLIASAPQRFIAPALAPAPAPAAAFTAQKFTSAKLTAPSREYLSPEVETFEPIVQQSYTAPAVTYNAPARPSASSAFTSDIDTQYSADGGYVY